MGKVKNQPESPSRESVISKISIPMGKRKSHATFVSPEDVNEASLQVWRTLPTKIRQDPSLAPFQLENERVTGSSIFDEDDKYVDPEPGPSNQFEMTSKDSGTNASLLNEKDGTIKSSSESNLTNNSAHMSKGSIASISNPWQTHSKMIFLLITWFCSMAFMTTESEKKIHQKLLSIDEFDTKSYFLPKLYYGDMITLGLEGPFLPETTNKSDFKVTLTLLSNPTEPEIIGYDWSLPIPNVSEISSTPLTIVKRSFYIEPSIYMKQRDLQILLRKNIPDHLAINLHYDPSPVNFHVGAICAAFVLLMFYVLIIYEVVHRTFAAIISSIVAIGLLAALNDKPTFGDIVGWMNCETLLLLFSMMILVGILTETGIFNYLAVIAFRFTNGRIWPLIFSLCLITATVAAFLHNVTTILLMTPITIKLCECLGLNPVPILMAVILNGNIGAASTPLGHVPNLLITGNPVFLKHGVTFASYTIHMTIGVVIAFIQTYIYIRWVYKDVHKLRTTEPKEYTDLRREISVWEKTAASLSTLTRENQVVRSTLMKKIAILQARLKKIKAEKSVSNETYRQTLEELQNDYPIKNRSLLVKAGIVLVFIIAMFFLQSIPGYDKLSIGWCALIGVMFLLIIAEKDNMDLIMHRIEWTTLLFFAAMFVTLECLERLGLVHWFSEHTINLISASDNENTQLATAIIVLVWLSGLLSSLVDSIPVTAMMIKIVTLIAEDESINLPIQPLVWAVAFGPCLGGNGTLYGASGNILCAGIAEQHGYKISFSTYFRRCFPTMILSLITTTVYLIVAHVIFQWHSG